MVIVQYTFLFKLIEKEQNLEKIFGPFSYKKLEFRFA